MYEYFPRGIDDIKSVTRILVTLLHSQSVPHVVNSILDFGEYWLRYQRSNSRHSHVEEPVLETPYLVAALVAPEPSALTPRDAVRKIRWTIHGRDQGWHDSHGTPDNKSWTWWVAIKATSENLSIERAWRIHAAGDAGNPNGRDPPPGPEHLQRVRTTERQAPGRTVLVNGFLRHDSYGLRSVDTERAHWAGDVSGLAPADWEQGIEIARNDLDSRHTTQYVAEASIFDPGDLGDWVRMLDLGQIIGVLPRALYPGWKCVTESAQIEVYIAAFVV